MELSIILPDQLNLKNPVLALKNKIIVLEDDRYFDKFKFNKKKLIFHRASMKYFFQHLKSKGYNVEYSENNLESYSKHKIHLMDPINKNITKKMKNLTLYENMNFLNTTKYNEEYFSKNKLFMASFYKDQRKKYKILLNSSGGPEGGKWSYDDQNRKKLPATEKVPEFKKYNSKFVKEAINYVEKKYNKNYGTSENFFYPTTHEESKKWFNDFLKVRFKKFGPYEDAISDKEFLIYHSLLSPLLNSGLIDVNYVVNTSLSYSKKNNIPINSVEGFIRQIIGWREFMRATYVKISEKQINNFWKFKNKIKENFWKGNTGIIPVDDAIKKAINTGYNHHIERLMILGNYMLLTEKNPDEVYKWFMTMYIDAYEWVMVPNVYSMSQYADGGLITTKPYLSGSNYIRKMSNYKKEEWCDIFDSLYWRFNIKYEKVISKNARLSIVGALLKKMSKEKKNEYIKKAENHIKL